MSHGRYALGLETMAPTVLRGPLKAWRYENEGVKDKTGIVVPGGHPNSPTDGHLKLPHLS